MGVLWEVGVQNCLLRQEWGKDSTSRLYRNFYQKTPIVPVKNWRHCSDDKGKRTGPVDEFGICPLLLSAAFLLFDTAPP